MDNLLPLINWGLSAAEGPLLASWTLTSPWMLCWLGLVIVPVLLHFLGKQAAVVIPWGAMGLLRRAAAQHARQYRLRRYLLLATRIGAVILLAIAWSDPTHWFPLPPQDVTGPQLWVLVLDGSISMDYRQQEESRWDLAKEWAKQQIHSAPAGTAFTLFVMADPPQVIVRHPAFRAADVLSELESLQVTHAEADLHGTLAEAQQIIQEAQKAFPQLATTRVKIFTDLEKSTWEEIREPAGADIAKQLCEKAQVHLHWVGATQMGQVPQGNQALLHATIVPSLLQAGETFQVEGELANFDTSRGHNRTVQLLAGGVLMDEQDVSIAVGGRATCILQGQANTAGDMALELRMSEDDFPADDVWFQIAVVRSEIRLLAVEGAPGELFPFQTAIRAGDQESNASIETISESALSDKELSGYDAIVLGNVAELSRQEGARIRRFVREGGGLLLFAGDRTNGLDLSNKLGVMGDGQADSILPCRLGKVESTSSVTLQIPDKKHPIVHPFMGATGTGLEDIPVWRLLEAVPSAGSHVAIALENGSPLLVTGQAGSGSVAVWTSSASPLSIDKQAQPAIAWSAFYSWPSFPPLAQEMLGYCIAPVASPRQFSSGERLRGILRPDNQLAATMSGQGSVMFELLDVDGKQEQIVMDRLEMGYAWEAKPRLRAEIGRLMQTHDNTPVQQLAINATRKESALEILDRGQLPSGFRLDSPAAQGDMSVTLPQPPRSEAWFRAALFAAFGLLLGEVLLLRWKRPRSSEG